MERFVATGATNEHGLKTLLKTLIKTLIAKAGAGQIIYFVAMCDRIAAILGLEGDTDPVGVRRSKAIAVLANPAAALDLLEAHAGTEPHPGDPDRSPVPLERPGLGHRGGPRGRLRLLRTTPPGRRVYAEKLRPKAVLYLRISEASLHPTLHPAGTTCTASGPVWPGCRARRERCRARPGRCPHRPARPAPAQHPTGPRPARPAVEAYEIPAAMREALRLARPTSVFPYSRAGSSTPDWRLHQPRPGIYLWRTRHGYWFRVDADGTHRRGRDPDLTAYDPPPTHGPMEAHLLDCITQT